MFKSPRSNNISPPRKSVSQNNSFLSAGSHGDSMVNSTTVEDSEEYDMMYRLKNELEVTRKQCICEEQKVAELEDQLITYSKMTLV